MNKARIGFIGAGGIAQRHLSILATFEDVELVAFADPAYGRAEQAASRYGAKAFDTHETLLQQGSVDAVYICIPPLRTVTSNGI